MHNLLEGVSNNNHKFLNSLSNLKNQPYHFIYRATLYILPWDSNIKTSFLDRIISIFPYTSTSEHICVASYVNIKSYLNTESSGSVQIGHVENFTGKYVFLIDEMIDSGRTMLKIRDKILKDGAKKAEIAIAFHKKCQ